MKTKIILELIFVLVIFVLSFKMVFAGFRPSFGGEYINLCGSGYAATFYSCPANCDINSGRCFANSVQHIYSFVCNGRGQAEYPNECRLNMVYHGTNTSLSVLDRASVNTNKTVQIDVFSKKCTDNNGNWICRDSDLLGYIVWYSGESNIISLPRVITLPPVETL